MTEPFVWVPTAAGTMYEATEAAEPLDEPPGVRFGSWGFCRLAGGIDGELRRHGFPHDDGARVFEQGYERGVLCGPAALVKGGAVLGRQAGGVDDVLDSDGNPVKWAKGLPFPSGAVGFSRLRQGEFLVQVLPGADLLFLLIDAGQARLDELFRGPFAFAYSFCGAKGAQLGRIDLFHQIIPPIRAFRAVRRFPCHSSVIGDAPPRPATWPPLRNPNPPGHRAKPCGRPGSRPRRKDTATPGT